MLAAQLAEHELQRLLEEERLEAVSNFDKRLALRKPISICSGLFPDIAKLQRILGLINRTPDQAVIVLDVAKSGF